MYIERQNLRPNRKHRRTEGAKNNKSDDKLENNLRCKIGGGYERILFFAVDPKTAQLRLQFPAAHCDGEEDFRFPHYYYCNRNDSRYDAPDDTDLSFHSERQRHSQPLYSESPSHPLQKGGDSKSDSLCQFYTSRDRRRDRNEVLRGEEWRVQCCDLRQDENQFSLFWDESLRNRHRIERLSISTALEMTFSYHQRELYDSTKDAATTASYNVAAVSFEIVLAIVAAFLSLITILAVTLPLIKKKKRTRASTYNLYLAFLAVPDLLYNAFLAYLFLTYDRWIELPSSNIEETYASNNYYSSSTSSEVPQQGGQTPLYGLPLVDHGDDTALFLGCATASLYTNVVICYEILKLLRNSKHRKRSKAPTLRKACIQASATYSLGILVVLVGVFAGDSMSHTLIVIPIVYVFTVAIPISYMFWVTYRIWCEGLLSHTAGTGRRMRVLVRYFLRIVFIFICIWLPASILYILYWTPSMPQGLLHYLACVFFAIQVFVSFGFSLTKPDIRRNVVDLVVGFLCCCCLEFQKEMLPIGDAATGMTESGITEQICDTPKPIKEEPEEEDQNPDSETPEDHHVQQDSKSDSDSYSVYLSGESDDDDDDEITWSSFRNRPSFKRSWFIDHSVFSLMSSRNYAGSSFWRRRSTMSNLRQGRSDSPKSVNESGKKSSFFGSFCLSPSSKSNAVFDIEHVRKGSGGFVHHYHGDSDDDINDIEAHPNDNESNGNAPRLVVHSLEEISGKNEPLQMPTTETTGPLAPVLAHSNDNKINPEDETERKMLRPEEWPSVHHSSTNLSTRTDCSNENDRSIDGDNESIEIVFSGDGTSDDLDSVSSDLFDFRSLMD
ncbi:unnamed protein product [Pseudo-nitzschia multistriata]|uniref:G-protein coupled receptors family 1 profile domain-containing protein n=1 Tax=Pseudo-nitzschia multistriata TaxID=183589 RepID=A0A448ZFF4_9STRA|nr:unnamed protein product [Pseudo-nitzschia multistriata]